MRIQLPRQDAISRLSASQEWPPASLARSSKRPVFYRRSCNLPPSSWQRGLQRCRLAAFATQDRYRATKLFEPVLIGFAIHAFRLRGFERVEGADGAVGVVQEWHCTAP